MFKEIRLKWKLEDFWFKMYLGHPYIFPPCKKAPKVIGKDKKRNPELTFGY